MNRAKCILVVDDNHSVVRTLELVLQHEGYQVVTAFDGVEALQKVSDYKPNLIILDIVMPKLDGYQVCHTLRANPKTAQIPVILLTIKGQVDGISSGLENKRLLEERVQERAEGFDAGAVEFLSKPIVAKQVVTQVKKFLALADVD